MPKNWRTRLTETRDFILSKDTNGQVYNLVSTYLESQNEQTKKEISAALSQKDVMGTLEDGLVDNREDRAYRRAMILIRIANEEDRDTAKNKANDLRIEPSQTYQKLVRLTELELIKKELNEVQEKLLEKVHQAYKRTDPDPPYQFTTKIIVNEKNEEEKWVTVTENDIEHLVFHAGKEGPPEDRSNKDINGPEVQKLLTLGRKVIWIVRAICNRGTHNNRLKPLEANDPENDFWKWYDLKKIGRKKRINYRYVADVNDAPGWLDSYGEHIWEWLKKSDQQFERAFDIILKLEAEEKLDTEEETKLDAKEEKKLDTEFKEIYRTDNPNPNLVVDMAAKGMPTYLNEGGVCSQLSHLTLGVLTLLAEEGTTLSLVTHNIDHSFVLIKRENTEWFVVDPWVGGPYVCPWRYSCFPRQGTIRHFQVDVIKPVQVPYGVVFEQEKIKRAQQLAKKSFVQKKPSYDLRRDNYPAIANTCLPRKVWTHMHTLSNNNDARIWKKSNLLVADSGDWGKGIFGSVQQRLKQKINKLNQSNAMAHSLAASSLFPKSPFELNLSQSNEKVLLDGMSVIFDQTTPVYPVTLEPKD